MSTEIQQRNQHLQDILPELPQQESNNHVLDNFTVKTDMHHLYSEWTHSNHVFHSQHAFNQAVLEACLWAMKGIQKEQGHCIYLVGTLFSLCDNRIALQEAFHSMLESPVIQDYDDLPGSLLETC